MKLTVSHKLCGFVFVCLILCPGLAPAYESLVEKKVFTLPSFTTVAGDVLKDVRFGMKHMASWMPTKATRSLFSPTFQAQAMPQASSRSPIKRQVTGTASSGQASLSTPMVISLSPATD